MTMAASVGLDGGARRGGGILRRAREVVRSGALGRVVMCRVGDSGRGREAARFVLGEEAVPGVARAVQGEGDPVAVFVGERATLAVYRDECRVYGSGGSPVAIRAV